MDADEVTEAALHARAGDPAAVARFVAATQADVWRLCAHLGDRGEADDLTQETYLRAFGGLPRFAGRSSVRTWLLAIARRVCADHVRERRRRPVIDGSVTELAQTAAVARSGTRRSCSPRWWACPTPRPRPCAAARSARSGPGSPVPARTSSANWRPTAAPAPHSRGRPQRRGRSGVRCAAVRLPSLQADRRASIVGARRPQPLATAAVGVTQRSAPRRRALRTAGGLR